MYRWIKDAKCKGGSRRGSLGGGTHTGGGGGTVMLGLFLVFVKPFF